MIDQTIYLQGNSFENMNYYYSLEFLLYHKSKITLKIHIETTQGFFPILTNTKCLVMKYNMHLTPNTIVSCPTPIIPPLLPSLKMDPLGG